LISNGSPSENDDSKNHGITKKCKKTPSCSIFYLNRGIADESDKTPFEKEERDK